MPLIYIMYMQWLWFEVVNLYLNLFQNISRKVEGINEEFDISVEILGVFEPYNPTEPESNP